MLLLEKPRSDGSPRAVTSTTGGASLRAALGVFAAAVTLMSTAAAAACPDCAVGVQARSEVWNQRFWFHLLVALLPFAVIAAICVYVEERERTREAGDRDRRDDAIAQTPASRIGAVVPERTGRLGS